MKRLTWILCFAIVATFAVSSFAQIVDVGTDEYGDNWTLKATIDADSSDPVDAYRLERGGWYWLSGSVEHDYHLTLIAADEPADAPPPVLLYATDEFGEAPNEMFVTRGDLTLKGLYFAGMDDLENPHDICQVVADGVRIEVTDCTFNFGNNWHGLFFFDGCEMYDFHVKRNMFINLQRSDGFDWTRLLFARFGDNADSLVMQHNTFWGVAGELYGFKGEPNHFICDHNTFVAEGQLATTAELFINAQITNNIYHNIQAHGDAIAPMTGFTRDKNEGQVDMPLATFMLDTLATEYPEALLDSVLSLAGIPHQTIKISHNNVYQSPELVDFLDSVPDSVALVPPVATPRTLAMAANDAEFPGIEYDEATITELDPGFTADPTNMDSLIAWANYQLLGGPPATWMWLPNPDTYLDFVWPLPKDVFDFTYSNDALKSDQGFHLGDLYHWYPDEYEAWATGVEERDIPAPRAFSLSQNYPNPFNPTTTINYTLEKAGDVSMTIYNVIGETVKTLVNASQSAGAHSVVWDATNDMGYKVAAGVYFYELEFGGKTAIQKMMLIK